MAIGLYMRVLLCATPTVTRVIRLYNGHLRGSMTLTPNAERLAVELSLPLLTTSVCRAWDSNTQPSAYGPNALTDCATAVVVLL